MSLASVGAGQDLADGGGVLVALVIGDRGQPYPDIVHTAHLRATRDLPGRPMCPPR